MFEWTAGRRKTTTEIHDAMKSVFEQTSKRLGSDEAAFDFIVSLRGYKNVRPDIEKNLSGLVNVCIENEYKRVMTDAQVLAHRQQQKDT